MNTHHNAQHSTKTPVGKNQDDGGRKAKQPTPVGATQGKGGDADAGKHGFTDEDPSTSSRRPVTRPMTKDSNNEDYNARFRAAMENARPSSSYEKKSTKRSRQSEEDSSDSYESSNSYESSDGSSSESDSDHDAGKRSTKGVPVPPNKPKLTKTVPVKAAQKNRLSFLTGHNSTPKQAAANHNVEVDTDDDAGTAHDISFEVDIDNDAGTAFDNLFDEFGVSADLMKNIVDNKLSEQSPAKEALSRAAFEGRDVLTRVESNDDETISPYLIPCVHKINKSLQHVQALILVPTYERMKKVSDVCKKLVNGAFSTLGFSDNTPLDKITDALKVSRKLIVATPGRLVELLDKQAIDLSRCKTLILDGADRLLLNTSAETLVSITQSLGWKPQIIVQFSEFTTEVGKLASNCLGEPAEFGLNDCKTVDELRRINVYLTDSRAKDRKQLDDERIYNVYGFSTSDKELFYAGQTDDFVKRTQKHFNEASTTQTQKVHKMLADQLKVGGVYVHKLFSGLTKSQANDKEHALIQGIEKNFKLHGNVSAGHSTPRFDALSDDDKAASVDRIFKETMEHIQLASIDELITSENVKEVLKTGGKFERRCNCGKIAGWTGKCRQCSFVVVPSGECKREKCPNGKDGLGEYGYCRNCYTNHHMDIIAGKTLPPYNSAPTVINRRPYSEFILGNHIQRALVISMVDRGNRAQASATEICKILGADIITVNTIKSWMGDVDAIEQGTAGKVKRLKFLKDKTMNKCEGLSAEAVKALVVWENSFKKQTVQQASDRLKRLFPEDANEFSVESIEDIYARIVEVKADLKSLFAKPNEPVEKKPKLDE